MNGVRDRVAFAELSAAQCRAYDALVARLGGADDLLIVECAFEPRRGAWAVRRVRDKKRRANFITTAWATLESVAEGLTAEELCAALAGGGGGGGGGGGAV